LNQQFRHRQFPAGNPLANVVVVIVGILVISLSLALGFIFFVGIAGFLLVMGVIMSVRNWWLRRRFGAQVGANKTDEPGPSGQPQIIEGEYQEVRSPDNEIDR